MINPSGCQQKKRALKNQGARARHWIVAATAGCLGGVNALAVNPEDVLVFSKGPVTLRPQLDLTEEYSDNILFTDTNRESDLATIVSPGLELDFGRHANYVNFEYNWDNFFYLDNDQLNDDQHRLRIDSQFEFNDFSVTGRDNIEFLSTFLSGGLSLRGTRIDRAVYRDEYNFRYNISEKTSVYFEGGHNTVDYDFPTLYDSTALLGSVGFSWLAFPKTSLFGELYYGETTRRVNGPRATPPDSWNLGGFIGARGSFTAKLTGTIKAGYETRQFGNGLGGATTPVVSVGLMEAFSEKSILRLTYTRQSHVSAEFVQSQFTADVIDLAFTQLIGSGERFRGTIGAYYNLDTYEGLQPTVGGTVERSDDLWRAYLNLTYDLNRWSSLRFGYEFEKFSSSHPAIIDYHVNRVTLSLALGY